MDGNLSTTNVLLGIMAAVSVLWVLIGIGIAVGAFMVYRRVMALVDVMESRYVAPVTARVTMILEDVKGVTARVKEETDRVDHAIRTTMDRVDYTADRVRWNVRAKTSRIVGFVRGLRVVLEELLTTHPHEPKTQHP